MTAQPITLSRAYRAIRWMFRQLGFGFFRLRVQGLEHIPHEGGVILAGNHPSVLDGFLLWIISERPVRFLIAEELFKHPLLRWSFEALGCIPVYRTRTHNGDALRVAIEALARGEAIGIFPEGTTSDRGVMRALRRGVGLLALKTGVPVVPFGIAGSHQAYPAQARIPRPGRIAMVFAPAATYPVHLEEVIPPEALQPALDDVQRQIRQAMGCAARAHDAPLPVWGLKRFEVALSSLIVLPLSAVLSLTANPSLDPATIPQTGRR